MSFHSLIQPVTSRPKSQFFGPAGGHGIMRDQLSLTTWLAVGALIQGMLFLVAGRLALMPIVFYLGYRATDTYLITIGMKKNPYMEGVISGKFSAQMPDEHGQFGSKPANSEVVVFLIGVRNNHPLGLLAPGFKQVGDYFVGMAKDLDTHGEDFGYLGMTSWVSANQRTSSNELMNVCYFKDHEGLHKFAHSKFHRKAWAWFNKECKSVPHISIYHETYVVPKGNWETLYVNSHVGHMAGTTYKITDKTTGETQWASPVVDASRGLLRTSKGRMSRSDSTEHDEYEENQQYGQS